MLHRAVKILSLLPVSGFCFEMLQAFHSIIGTSSKIVVQGQVLGV
ncbi:MAG: hypothetical protein HW418_3697 [Anaerolineales bacterium]|nr:hypothetical protein [Anaerolineales bacterium]